MKQQAAEDKSVDEDAVEVAADAAVESNEDEDIIGPPLPPGYQVSVFFHCAVRFAEIRRQEKSEEVLEC